MWIFFFLCVCFDVDLIFPNTFPYKDIFYDILWKMY